ncbi:hypothetical protein EDD57_1634 [Baia soyae]|uniref:Uncharacterized protein n=1 Tax=Baia soyae TaxID=1544746 RepID=A0A4R2RCZ6_9BACL|nr:hypothetical protein EDD57_1634 [Baia soyae]
MKFFESFITKSSFHPQFVDVQSLHTLGGDDEDPPSISI